MGAIRFKTGDDQWRIVFQHGETTREVGKKKQEVKIRFTTAIVDKWARLHLLEADTAISRTVGMTLCSPSDQFCRAAGRKIALQRALVEYDRATRAAFWREYWQAVGKMEFVGKRKSRAELIKAAKLDTETFLKYWKNEEDLIAGR
jgi:hypothetical protein